MTNEISLDYAFLKHLGVTADGTADLHGFYLPYLSQYQRILDLGSGMGGFVQLLCHAGKDAYGVDSDPGCIAESRQRGIPVVEADVVDHLRGVAPESLDAIFSAHLVEHMPYDAVLEVMRLAHRALRPGGRLLLATPNPRALVSHLELYHMHFGHVALYQPDLLAFFMQQAGFAHTEIGNNPQTRPQDLVPHSLLARLRDPAAPAQAPADPGTLLPARLLPRPRNPVKRAIWVVKMGLLRWLVQPFTDQLAARDRQLYTHIYHNAATLQRLLQLAEQPFECFAIGDKSSGDHNGGAA